MKVATLRAINKIHSNVLRNSRRLLSYKFEMTPSSRGAEEQEDVAEGAKDEQPRSFRYNVCQPRTSPVTRPLKASDIVLSSQQQNVRAAIEEQHLQPAMLPEYYQKTIDKSVLVNPEADANEQTLHQQPKRFQLSKTHTNASFPLKSVKLASPFPEPVKMMMSRTVSDEEKAEQMLADSRSQRSIGDSKKNTFTPFTSEVKRWYSNDSSQSTDDPKCKKFKNEGKKGCPKIKLHNCPPRARMKCDREAITIHCKKQAAPYPAYSEFCHEDIEEKPSECKMCPWRIDEHPTFKPPKKKFHTAANLGVRRSGLEMTDWYDYKQTKDEEFLVHESQVEDAAVEEDVGMQCDLRKPPCERPSKSICPPTNKKEVKKEDKPKEKPKKKCLTEVVSYAIMPEEVITHQDVIAMKSIDPKAPSENFGQCKIKKFKFPKCGVVVRKEEVPETGCPKKKRRKFRDCPPTDEKEKCGLAEQITMEYGLSAPPKKPDKSKCPRIDMTVLIEEEDEDPCKLKKKDSTKICPKDLLKKKKRNPRKKDASAYVRPESENQRDQPNI